MEREAIALVTSASNLSESPLMEKPGFVLVALLKAPEKRNQQSNDKFLPRSTSFFLKVTASFVGKSIE